MSSDDATMVRKRLFETKHVSPKKMQLTNKMPCLCFYSLGGKAGGFLAKGESNDTFKPSNFR